MKKLLNKFITLCVTFLTIFFASGCDASLSVPASSSGPTSSSSQSDVYILTLDKKTYTIGQGESVPLNITFTNNGINQDQSLLTITISDPTIASTDGATINGLKIGLCDLTVSFEKNKQISKISVLKNEIKLTTDFNAYSLTIDSDTPTKTIITTATLNGAPIINPEINYVSADQGIATVNSNGLITPIAQGATTITISYRGVNKTVNVSVRLIGDPVDPNTFSEEAVNLYGRTYITNGSLYIDNASSGIEVSFTGSSLHGNVTVVGDTYIRVFVDGDSTGTFKKITTNANFNFIDGLTNEMHTVKILKATGDSLKSSIIFKQLFADEFYSAPPKPTLKIEAVGDSITAGYGILGPKGAEWSNSNSDSTLSYASVAANQLNAELSVVALPGICVSAFFWRRDINMTMLYKYVSDVNRTQYAFNDTADVVVINLGTNDDGYIYGDNQYKDPTYIHQFPTDYQNFLEYVRLKRPNAYIVSIYGFMSKRLQINNAIAQAVAATNDDKIFYYADFNIDKDGAAGHPSINGSIANGQILANHIQALLNN